MFDLYSDVILTRDVPEDRLKAGDIGTVVEHHFVSGKEPGYSVEFYDLLGDTVAVATVPESFLRSPAHEDRPSVRTLAGTHSS